MREYATDRLGADYIATGHYARLWHRGGSSIDDDDDDDSLFKMPMYVEEMIADAPERDWIASWGGDEGGGYGGGSIGGTCMVGGRQSSSLSSLLSSSLSPLLLAGADLGKDQSYFLCGVNDNAFRNVLFPLGDLFKKKDDGSTTGTSTNDTSADTSNKSVREIAIDAGLPTATKRESMGICFIGRRNFQSFISQYLPSVPRPGSFVDVDTGEVRILGVALYRSSLRCICPPIKSTG